MPRSGDVLDRLVALFLAEGFSSFGVGDLAERLRCSRSTLYSVAPSKEQIVVAAVTAYFKGAAARIEARVAATEDPGERLAAYLEAVAEELQPASTAFHADLAGFPPADAVYRANTAYAGRRIQDLVREGVAAGSLREVDATFVGAAVSQVMAAIQRGDIEATAGLDDATAYRHLADLVLAGLTRR